MRKQAIADLVQFGDDKFFEEVSKGMRCVVQNLTAIESDASFLAQGRRPRGTRVLRVFAKEESAKYLILLDAVRCPRGDDGPLAEHLKRFEDHLVRGIYAEYYGEWNPQSFGEAQEYVEDERKDYYLDGPNDVDWIFRNRILRHREQAIYVDYVETDGDHMWFCPQDLDEIVPGSSDINKPDVIDLVCQLDASGFSQPAALELIGGKWRSVEMTDGFPRSEVTKLNCETLEELRAAGLLQQQRPEVYARIIDRLLFPLYSLDLSRRQVDQSQLRESQKRAGFFT